jgi:2'-5' RNA ligase
VSGTEEGVRAFVALELDASVHLALEQLQARLAPGLPGIRLAHPDRIHLTLRFLGQTLPAQIERLRPLLAAAAARCAAVEAGLGPLGTFPDRGRPHVLWLGLDLPAPALELQRECERAARAAGFAAETRPFRAHLTLGRWRDSRGRDPGGHDPRAGRPTLPAVDLGRARLRTLALLESDLRPEGARHTALSRFELGGGTLD